MTADEVAIFEVLQGLEPFESLTEFEGGSYLEYNRENVAPPSDEDPTYVGVSGQANEWFPNFERSSTSTLEQGGESYPYGVVHMMACLESRWAYEYSSDEEQPPSEVGQFFPYEVTVQYDPSRHLWLIVDETWLDDDEAASLCPST